MLQTKYKDSSKYLSPYIVKLALEARFSHEREKIEKWFQDVPESAQQDVLARLRSVSSKQHFGAYYELVTGEFFKKLGYSVEMSPAFGSDNPDLLVTGLNLEKPIVIEVATVFDDPEWEKEDRKLNVILDQLDMIRHYYFLGVTVKDTPIPENIDYDSLRNFVITWFDSFDPKVTEVIKTTQYDKDGLKLSLDLIPKSPRFRKKKGLIRGAHSLPARFISNQQLRNALKKKATKYNFVKEQGLPYIVALSLYDASADNQDVVDQLFGKRSLTISRDAEGHFVNQQQGRDSSGICKPNQNSRLTGVITIKSNWANYSSDNLLTQKFISSKLGILFQRQFPDIVTKPTMMHNFSLIQNPFATVQLKDQIMTGYPKFTKTEENTFGITYSWIDEQSDIPFDC